MSINVLSSEQTWIMDGLFRLAEGRIWLVKEAMEYASSDPTRDPLLEEVVEYILKKVERLRAKEGRA